MKSKLYKICIIMLFAYNLFALTENESLLFKAIEENNAKEIERLIKIKDLDINVLNDDGYAPIHIAVLKRNDEALKALLKNKNINIEMPIDDNTELNGWYLGGETALLFAAYLYNLNALNILLDAGANINAKDNIDETTALHIAAANGNDEIIKRLLEYAKNKKIDIIESLDMRENTPLHWAAMMGYSKTVELLLKNKADINAVDEDGWTALHYAASFDAIETIQVLLDNGASIDSEDYNGEKPVYYSSDEKVIALLGGKEIEEDDEYYYDENTAAARNSDILTQEQNELLLAVKNGDIISINNLIKNGIDVNFTDAEGYTPIHRAISYGKRTSLESLLKAANINIEAKLPENTIINNWYLEGATPLLLASYLGYDEIVSILLNNAKADIFARDDVDGAMAIHIASANGHVKVINAILNSQTALKEGQAKVINAGDENGDTALIWAIMKRKLNAVDILLKYGADVNTKNAVGETVIHYAANSEPSVIDILYKNGANLNEKTMNNNNTPMHYATRANNLENVKKLVELGADQNMKDINGKTPYDIAEDLGYYGITEYLSSLYTTIPSKQKKEKWWSSY